MTKASTFCLEVTTSEWQLYTGLAEVLVLPVIGDEVGVHPGHEPVITTTEPGELCYKVDGGWESAVVSMGFVEIKSNYMTLLVGFAGYPEEIDRKWAGTAREWAKGRPRQKQSIHEYYHSKAILARAVARLKTCRR